MVAGCLNSLYPIMQMWAAFADILVCIPSLHDILYVCICHSVAPALAVVLLVWHIYSWEARQYV